MTSRSRSGSLLIRMVSSFSPASDIPPSSARPPVHVHPDALPVLVTSGHRGLPESMVFSNPRITREPRGAGGPAPFIASSQLRQLILLGRLWEGLVDPCLLGQARRDGAATEPLGVLGMGAVQSRLAPCPNLRRGPEVDRGGGVHADPGVAVLVVVGGEEPAAELAGVGQ